MRWRPALLTACSALVLAGCGGSALDGTLARAARDAARGDGCAAQALLRELIAAVNAGDVPPQRQEVLLSLANGVAADARCPGELNARARVLAQSLSDELDGPLSLLDVLRDVALRR